MNDPLILASASPQRARLLEQLRLTFTAIPADIDETLRAGESAQALAERLARTKAEALSSAYPRACIIGSDTVVACGAHIFGKPRDGEDAAVMLAALSDRRHRVISAVALYAAGQTTARVQTSHVTLRAISEDEIAAYWASGEPEGKAGGYAIQGMGAIFIAALEGSYSAVMGLPLFETAELLRAGGHDPLLPA